MSEPERLLLRRKPSSTEQADGPFQRKARNLGMAMEVVVQLPREWPQTADAVEDALYDAGVLAGETLMQAAEQLWKHRPAYRRERKT